jgi:hypothetical protein
MIPQSITQVDPFSLIKHKSLPNDWRAQMREAVRLQNYSLRWILAQNNKLSY